MSGKNSVIKIIILFFSLIFLLPVKSSAEDINVKELIFEHIGDDYQWHIASWGETSISLPLPIIVMSKEQGWQLFLSSKLQHGAVYKGFSIAQEGSYKGKVVEYGNQGELIRPILDISLTKNALALLINCAVILLVILPLARWYKRGNVNPAKGFKGAVEMLLINIQDEVIKPSIGRDYKKFSPYLLTAFFFIFVNNLMGLVPFFPGGANVTGNIAVTLALAGLTFIVVNVSGTKEYWKEIFWPDVPLWLKVPAPLMPLIELFGVFTKPFALAIRLFANIMAGHSVIIGLVCVIFITASMGAAFNTGMTVVAVLFGVFMSFLEILVAYIQAYVFTLLSAVFIGMARVK